MLTRQEILDYYLVNSGQFMIPDYLANTGMSNDQFELIIKQCLKSYSDFIPVVKEQRILVNNEYTFTDNPKSPSFIVSIELDTNSYFHQGLNRISKHFWSYEDNKLKIRQGNGYYIAKLAYRHEYDDEQQGIPTMTMSDTTFLDMVMAQMMIAVGRARRLFQINDLPFTVDHDSMISEGTELKDSVSEKLKERAKTFLGY